MAPSEDVSITSEKNREHLVEYEISEGSNLGRSVKFRVVKKHLFKFLYGLRRYPVFFFIAWRWSSISIMAT